MRTFSRGFTLIELLIVVAIIAILAAIAVPNFLEAQVRSKVSRAKADMRSIATAVESYAVDNNKYPPAVEYGSMFMWGDVNMPPYHMKTSSYFTTPISYMSSLPSDVFGKRPIAHPAASVFGHLSAILLCEHRLSDRQPDVCAPRPERLYGGREKRRHLDVVFGRPGS